MKNKDFDLVANVNGVIVKGTDDFDFARKYIAQLIAQNHELMPNKRLQHYVTYFLKNFKYDDGRKDAVLSGQYRMADSATSKRELSRLLATGVGVCRQFAQILALAAKSDQTLSKQIRVESASFRLVDEYREMGHAVNLCFMHDKLYVIDLSSAIHCRDKVKGFDLQSSDFIMVDTQTYVNNLFKVGASVVPNTRGHGACFMVNGSDSSRFSSQYELSNCVPSESPKSSKLFRSTLRYYMIPDQNVSVADRFNL